MYMYITVNMSLEIIEDLNHSVKNGIETLFPFSIPSLPCYNNHRHYCFFYLGDSICTWCVCNMQTFKGWIICPYVMMAFADVTITVVLIFV